MLCVCVVVCVCGCVLLCVCVYLCVRRRIQQWWYAIIHDSFTSVFVFVCFCVYTYTCVCVCVCVWMCMCTYSAVAACEVQGPQIKYCYGAMVMFLVYFSVPLCVAVCWSVRQSGAVCVQGPQIECCYGAMVMILVWFLVRVVESCLVRLSHVSFGCVLFCGPQIKYTVTVRWCHGAMVMFFCIMANESCLVRMSHVSYNWVVFRLDESCFVWLSHVSYEWVTVQWSYFWYFVYERVMSRMTESRHTCDWVMSRSNESRCDGPILGGVYE